MRILLVALCAAFALARPALAQQAIQTPNGAVVPTVGAFPVVNGAPVSNSNPLPTTPATGAASSTQSITQTTVAVSANTDTVVSAASTTLRSLGIFVQTSGAPCNLAFGIAAASGVGLLLGSGSTIGYGYTWGAADPPPNNAVHAYCTTAATIVVWQGN
jgi:hypothetical protein